MCPFVTLQTLALQGNTVVLFFQPADEQYAATSADKEALHSSSPYSMENPWSH